MPVEQLHVFFYVQSQRLVVTQLGNNENVTVCLSNKVIKMFEHCPIVQRLRFVSNECIVMPPELPSLNINVKEKYPRTPP